MHEGRLIRRNKTNKESCAATPGSSSSVQIGLDEEARLPRLHKLLSLRATCAGAIARRVARQLV